MFTALFSLLGPLAATLLLLSAFGRPLHLALLVLPVSYHHQVWFGFLGSSAAITGILLALAFARRSSIGPALGNHLGLAGALLFVAAAHPFPLALTLAAVAPLLVWPALAAASPGVDGGRGCPAGAAAGGAAADGAVPARLGEQLLRRAHRRGVAAAPGDGRGAAWACRRCRTGRSS